jgi:hypothetical protein
LSRKYNANRPKKDGKASSEKQGAVSARQRRYKSEERGTKAQDGWHKSLRYIEE